MLDLSKYVVDTSDWNSLAIINPENGDEIAYFSVGDSNVFSFVYIDEDMYISEPGLSHYSAVWNYFCEKNGLHPKNQKKYVINEIKKICDDIKSNKVKCDGRFYKGYNIIQILTCDNPNITKDKVIFDICNNFGVSRNECYLLQEKPTDIVFETRIEKLQEEKNYYFTQKQIDLFESKQVINESSRDNLLLPYLELVQKIEPNITLGQLKNYLMKKFVTEGNIHALSLSSNFYLSGVARYYFNGDLTTNKKLNIFYPNVTDEFIVDVCQRLDEIIIYLRNSYIDTTGTKWLQPEDFGSLSIAKLFRKYGGIIDKLKVKQDKYKTNTEDKYSDVSNKIGNNYTYDIMYDYEDCRKYNSATSPGAWCITYGKQHYDGYTKRNESHFIIFKKDGYETIERKIGKNFPLDEYGLSLLAVQQSNKTGEFICCTSRWNHGGYGSIPTIENADNVLSFNKLKKITGVNDSEFELIFNVWKEQNDKKSTKRLEKGKENLILTDIIRTFKYCQMMIQNGSNLKQLFDNNLIDDAILLSDNKEYNTNIDKVKISKNIIALRTTKDEVSKWTICDRGILMPEQVLGDNFSSGNNDIRFGCAPEEFKDNIVIFNTNRKGSVLYCKKTHNIISINDNKYFKKAQNIGDSKYFLLLDERDAFYVLDSTTFKPLYTPNNECVFENVTYYKFCNVLKMVYDRSAKSIYYYNLNNNSFIDKIYGTEVSQSMDFKNIEKKGILPLINFVPSMDYHSMYQTHFFDIGKNEYLKDTNGEIVKDVDDVIKHIRTKRKENTKKQEDKDLDYVVEQVLNETTTLFNTFNKQSNIIFNKKLLENIDSNEIKDVINTFETQDELNTKFWVDGKLNSRVRLRLLDIADKFIDSLNVSWIKPTDIIMTGSLCNYNWSKYSDIDLHILVDFKKVHERNDFVKEYFDSKRKLWNDTHDNLMIYGFPVELYVQDTNEEHISSAIYSLEKNEWVIEPTKNKFEVLNKEKTWLIKKSKEIMKTIDSFEDEFSKETDEKKIDILSKKVKKLFDKIKKGRKHDLQKNGEFGLINLLFKVLRRCGYLKKLLDLKIETFDKIMSIK